MFSLVLGEVISSLYDLRLFVASEPDTHVHGCDRHDIHDWGGS